MRRILPLLLLPALLLSWVLWTLACDDNNYLANNLPFRPLDAAPGGPILIPDFAAQPADMAQAPDGGGKDGGTTDGGPRDLGDQGPGN